MGTAVYLLCLATSSLCTVMLYLKYRASQAPLLLWTSIGFGGLAVNNGFLVLDMIVFPQADLSIVRTIPALVGLAVMISGFVWEGL